MKKRKLSLDFTPKVETSCSDHSVKITTGGWTGGTRWEATGQLSIECAARLVVDLRKALREIRAYNMQRMDAAVNKAEGPV